MTLKEAIAQIEFCDFQCHGGPLKNNEGWIELKKCLDEIFKLVWIIAGATNKELLDKSEEQTSEYAFRCRAYAQYALEHYGVPSKRWAYSDESWAKLPESERPKW